MQPGPHRSIQTILIIGAGPAGLTAAYELLRQSSRYRVIVIEADEQVGGLSRTVNHKGNRMDIGGHRFFSKSDRVMNWWLHILPLENTAADSDARISYHGRSAALNIPPVGSAATNPDNVMLLRKRRSRIYFLHQFFDYPLTLSLDTLSKLGWERVIRIGFSYLYRAVFPKKETKHLEDFFINRFGGELYRTFFKSYTEKVWGIPCDQISAAWGAQRIKKLSITRALLHALRPKPDNSLRQKSTDTSLVEQFLYPKYGPGHLWELAAEAVQQMGGELRLRAKVVAVQHEENAIRSVTIEDGVTGLREQREADFVLSSMPVKHLMKGMQPEAPSELTAIAEALPYRAFITVGVLLRQFGGADAPLTDNWLYIQDGSVQVGRIQIFNNWSPHLVKDPGTWWIGMEYFCNEGDALWQLSNAGMAELAVSELERLQLAKAQDVMDHTVIRMPKTYPVYSGVYEQFDELRAYLDGFENLFLIGRNGMHKYNNQDHSMLTAMQAVENILTGVTDKSNIWAINTEEDYHEGK